MRCILSLLLLLIVQTSITLASSHGRETIDKSKSRGIHLYGFNRDHDLLPGVSSACGTAMTRTIECHDHTYMFDDMKWRAGLQNDPLSDLVCDKTCGESIQAWFESVSLNCADHQKDNVVLTKPGGILWAGWNETCLKDPDTDRYCGGKLALGAKNKPSS